jgi:carbamoyltransferase
MEWGPRALGNRSIVADCRSEEITKKINGSIKNRPFFQPYCPSILEEERERLFEKSYPNKHMTCAFRMRQEHRNNIPASVHVDGTGRAQFVEEKDNPMYFRYLKELKKLTGYGVSINTSFNKHGRTIVETPKDAIQDFLDTNMDFVMIEGYLVTRK